MKTVVGHVDDWDVGPSGVFQQHLVAGAVVRDLVLQDADADTCGITGHHLGRVLNCLSSLLIGLEATRCRGHKLGMPSQLCRSCLERQAGAHRGIVKEHNKGLVLQNPGPAIGETISFHLGRQIKGSHQPLNGPILSTDKVTLV